MHSDGFGKTTSQSLARSILFVAGCVVLVGLALVPFAATLSGTNGVQGLALAAGLCIFAAVFAESIAFVQGRNGSHLIAMLLAMAVRDIPLLAICLALAVAGQTGEQHLGFVCYLLAFYLIALASETWLAVKRVSAFSANAGIQNR
jgi:hypothetical protein